jgi:hypothetical protein
MNTSDAFRILQLENDTEIDEIFDRYDEILFECKNYFIHKIPIEKLFSRKIAHLKEVEKAFEFLTNRVHYKTISLNFQTINEAEIYAQFTAFHRTKNTYKTYIFHANNITDILQVAPLLVQLEKENARVWATDIEKEETILVSKDTDPMRLLDAINHYQILGGKTFEQLKKLQNKPPEVLIHEMKRLSLLFKHY